MVLHELVRFGSKRFHEEVRQLMKMVLASVTLILRRSEPILYGNRYAKDIFTRGPDFHRDRRRADYQFGRVSILFSPLLFSPIAFWSPV